LDRAVGGRHDTRDNLTREGTKQYFPNRL